MVGILVMNPKNQADPLECGDTRWSFIKPAEPFGSLSHAAKGMFCFFLDSRVLAALLRHEKGTGDSD